jgi:diacylglycerol kinase family enzyme
MKVAAIYGPRALTDDARPFQFGQHLRLPEIEYFRFRHIRFETPTPTEIYADGDFLCHASAEISVVRGGSTRDHPARLGFHNSFL